MDAPRSEKPTTCRGRITQAPIKWTKNESGTWSCSFLTAFGRRTINTLLTDKREAVRQARQTRILMRQAHRFETKVGQMFSTGRLVKLTDARDEWIDSLRRESNVSERTLAGYIVQLTSWLRKMKLTEEQVCVVTEDHVTRWVNADDGTKASTRKNRLKLLRTFLNYCMFKSYHPGNPARIVRKVNMSNLTHAQKEPRRKEPFTDDEILKLQNYIEDRLRYEQAILDRLSPRQRKSLPMGYDTQDRIDWLKFWRCAIMIGRWAGLRIGDIAGLEHASLTKPNVLCVWTDKRDRRVEIPINEPLASAFRYIPITDPVFVFKAQQKINASPQRAQLSSKFSKLLEECEIKGKSFHCLRSTFSIDAVDRLMASGKTRDEAVEIVRALVGHGNKSTTEKYYLNGETK